MVLLYELIKAYLIEMCWRWAPVNDDDRGWELVHSSSSSFRRHIMLHHIILLRHSWFGAVAAFDRGITQPVLHTAESPQRNTTGNIPSNRNLAHDETINSVIEHHDCLSICEGPPLGI
nr:hypothetical protein CFP56_54899 [Quercus suber]